MRFLNRFLDPAQKKALGFGIFLPEFIQPSACDSFQSKSRIVVQKSLFHSVASRFLLNTRILFLSLIFGLMGLATSFARIFFLALVFTLLGISPAFAWVNGNFETCNLNGWTTSTNTGPNVACGPPTATSTTVGWAPLSNNMLPRVHGGNCAAQLYSARGDTNHVDWARIEQSDTVPTDGNTCLSFWFAAVMEDHHYEIGQSEDTYIEADVILGGTTVASLVYNWTNNLGQIIPDGLTGTGGAACAITPNTQNNWGYLPWTNFQINLCPYAGQKITLRITDYDCGQGGHYGYGYVDDVTWDHCPLPLITLTKSNSPNGPVSQGATITYTLNYQNTGAGPATNVVVTDPIPPATTLVPGSISSNPSVPSSQTGGSVVWNVGRLAPGTGGTLTFKVTASQACVTVVNRATENDLAQLCYVPGVTSNSVTNTVGGCPVPTSTVTSTKTSTTTSTSTPIPATATLTAIPTNTPTWTNTIGVATATATFASTNTPTATNTPGPQASTVATIGPTDTITSTNTPGPQ
ncbi:MAG TPA: DUF11 domain-containing protein, partial [bacterium]